MKDVPSQLALLVRSVVFKQEGLVTDFEAIEKEMKSRTALEAELVSKTMDTLNFLVRYQENSYQVVFVHFKKSALAKEDVDVVITKV